MSKVKIVIFWVILLAGFGVRLYKIDNPVADWHSWRQADTAAVTRNFLTYGVNPFIPRYDDLSDVSGEGLVNPSGFRMVEFPLFNLVHLSLYYLHPAWGLVYWGRMTAILSWLVASLGLFFLVKRHADENIGLTAMALFLFLPYTIFFSRIILPDQLMVALSLLTLNSFDLWLKKEKPGLFLLTAVLGAFALLVKPVAVFILLPMVWQSRHKLKNIQVYMLAAAIILPLLLWREWIAKFPEGIPASAWLFNGNHIRFKPAFFRWIFGERLGGLILGKWGLVPFFFGIVASCFTGYFLTLFLGSLLYLVVFATGNIQHDYYQIVIMPAVAAITALGINRLLTPEPTWLASVVKKILTLFCLILMMGLSWFDIMGDYQVNHWEIIRAGNAILRLTQPKAVVIATYMGDTAFLYQTNHRGFAVLSAPIKDMKDLWGVSYYTSTNYDAEASKIINKYSVVEETPEYVVVRLEEPKLPLTK